MDWGSFLVGFIFGLLFIFIFSNYFCRKLAHVLKEEMEEVGNDDDPANWWKRGGNSEY